MNSKVIFHTGFEYTLLSKKLYDFLVNKIFVNYIKKDICRVVPTPFEALFCPNIDKINIDFRPDFTKKVFRDLKISIPYLDRRLGVDEISYIPPGIERFEYAYAITTHLSQGAEYPIGIYYEEFLRSNIQNQLNYTGITRFKDYMIYVKHARKYY